MGIGWQRPADSLKKFNERVVLPSVDDIQAFAATGRAQREEAAGKGGPVQQAPNLGSGGSTPRAATAAAMVLSGYAINTAVNYGQ